MGALQPSEVWMVRVRVRGGFPRLGVPFKVDYRGYLGFLWGLKRFKV